MQLGEHRIEIVQDAEFWLDGGAMFGVVPRVLWERVTPPDEANRVRLNMNCVFIDTGKERILIDTGIGEKWDPKGTAIYGIDRQRSFADSLRMVTGYTANDITIVVNTHLHFDHAGGNTVLDRQPSLESSVQKPAGKDDNTSRNVAALEGISRDLSAIPQFPNARYLVSKAEYNEAENPHERERASYLSENWRPLKVSGQLELMPDEFEVIPGLKFQTERGHSPTMQTWRLCAGSQTLYGFADLIPTRHHIPLPWIMGYDLEPALTLEYKKRILGEAVRGGWLCLFYHEPDTPICTLREQNGKVLADSWGN